MINDDAIGYAVAAYYQLLSGTHKDKQAKCNQFANCMYRLFDVKTEDEANQIRKAILYGTQKEVDRLL